MKKDRTITFHGKPLALEGTVPEIGSRAPDFTVLDQASREVGLPDYRGKVKLVSVTPSIDTPVCDVQARRLNEEAARLPVDVVVLNISMDLPFALSRYCAAAGIDRVKTLSDHREASFGRAYGVLISELRLLARSIFLLDRDDRVRYIEIVPDLSEHPDYEKVLRALREVVDISKAA